MAVSLCSRDGYISVSRQKPFGFITVTLGITDFTFRSRNRYNYGFTMVALEFRDGYTLVSLQIRFRVPTVTLRFHIGYIWFYNSPDSFFATVTFSVSQQLHFGFASARTIGHTWVSRRLHFGLTTFTFGIYLRFHDRYTTVTFIFSPVTLWFPVLVARRVSDHHTSMWRRLHLILR